MKSNEIPPQPLVVATPESSQEKVFDESFVKERRAEFSRKLKALKNEIDNHPTQEGGQYEQLLARREELLSERKAFNIEARKQPKPVELGGLNNVDGGVEVDTPVDSDQDEDNGVNNLFSPEQIVAGMAAVQGKQAENAVVEAQNQNSLSVDADVALEPERLAQLLAFARERHEKAQKGEKVFDQNGNPVSLEGTARQLAAVEKKLEAANKSSKSIAKNESHKDSRLKTIGLRIADINDEIKKLPGAFGSEYNRLKKERDALRREQTRLVGEISAGSQDGAEQTPGVSIESVDTQQQASEVVGPASVEAPEEKPRAPQKPKFRIEEVTEYIPDGLELSADEIAAEVKNLIGDLAQVDNLSIVGTGNEFKIDADLVHKKGLVSGGAFTLQATLTGSGDTLRVGRIVVTNAGFGKQGFIEREINKNLPRLVPEITRYLSNKYGKQVAGLSIEDGKLNVRFPDQERTVEKRVPIEDNQAVPELVEQEIAPIVVAKARTKAPKPVIATTRAVATGTVPQEVAPAVAPVDTSGLDAISEASKTKREELDALVANMKDGVGAERYAAAKEFLKEYKERIPGLRFQLAQAENALSVRDFEQVERYQAMVRENPLVSPEERAVVLSGRSRAYIEALHSYKELQDQYVNNRTRRYIAEQISRTEESAGEHEKGWFTKMRKATRWLGDQNANKLIETDSKLAKFGLRMASARTAISGGLLAAGLFAAPLAPASLAVRTAMSGTMAGFGSYDLMRASRENKTRQQGEDLVTRQTKEGFGIDINETRSMMVALEAQARFSGARVVHDPVYVALKKQLLSAIRQKERAGESLEGGDLAFLETQRFDVMKEERRTERDTKIKAAGVGVGTALLGRLFGGLFGGAAHVASQ